jgi:uncharacterized membrane protein YccC
MRAVRATLVMPALFALTFEVIGNTQIALFAAFGSFATLVMASFGGTAKDKVIAHLQLAIVGSIGLTIGTLVNGHWWLATIATAGVTFAMFFAGVITPTAAAGTNAALLSFVLPVATSGTASMIPDRLAGWWMASVAGTLAVLLLSPRGPGDRLRAATADLASALADRMAMVLSGEDTPAAATVNAKHKVIDLFTSTPYRPTGLTTADQALGSVIQTLEWCTALLCDAFDGHLDLNQATAADRELLRLSGQLLRDVADLLSGRDAAPDLAALEKARHASAAALRDVTGDDAAYRAAAAHGAHAQAIAVAARTAAADALIAARRADPETVAVERRQWYGAPSAGSGSDSGSGDLRESMPRVAAFAGAAGVVMRHATARSVWMVNSLRGAAALAAAVGVADLSGVQHGFWVVLGTMSVLRTNAGSTGATALRALAGTVVGFVVGAALLQAIGTGPVALWIALPFAVLVASYAPGTAPFVFGQAAFTVVVAVLFNLLVPVGWKVGLLRVQDVAIGCAVSIVVGLLFWPRGAGSVVGSDLADAFRYGAEYLAQSVDWAVGAVEVRPTGGPAAVAAGLRLDDALRAYLTEQGSKRVARRDMWALVMGTMRLRLTANVLAGLHPKGPLADADALRSEAAGLGAYYGEIADEVGSPHGAVADGTAVGGLPDGTDLHHQRLLLVSEHLEHLRANAQSLAEPAGRFAAVRQRPWWR